MLVFAYFTAMFAQSNWVLGLICRAVFLICETVLISHKRVTEEDKQFNIFFLVAFNVVANCGTEIYFYLNRRSLANLFLKAKIVELQ